jgi:hypothetical protein
MASETNGAGLDGDESGADAPANQAIDERFINGPIYQLVDLAMRAAQLASAVESIKRVAFRICKATKPEVKRRVANWVIDLFMVSKWALLMISWRCGTAHWLVIAVLTYLLIWNSLTYFHYHLWIVELPKDRVASSHRERRRFVSLVLAMAYSVATYGYLYQCALSDGFEWPASVPRWISSISFSIGNALTSQAGGLRPITSGSYLLSASQLVFTFGFVAMLLSSSLPRVRPAEAEKSNG